MNGDLHHIDDLFKSGMEGKEDNPSLAVWKNIEQELDKKDSRPKFFLWWNSRKIAAAALIILASAGLFAGGYYLRGMRIENKDTKLKNSKNNSAHSGNENPAGPGSVASTDVGKGSPGNTNPGTVSSKKANRVGAGSVANDNQEQNGADPVSQTNPKTKNENTHQPPQQKSAGNAAASSDLMPENKSTGDKHIGTTVKTSGIGNKPTRSSQTDANSSVKTWSSTRKSSKYEKPVYLTKSNETVGANDSRDNMQATTTVEASSSKTWHTEQTNPQMRSRIVPVPKTNISSSPQHALESKAPSSAIPVLNKRSSLAELPKFTISPVVSWQFGSNRIVANNSYPDADKVKSEITRTESQPSSIGAGIVADLRIARNMTVQSGLILTSRTIQIDPKFIKAERNADGKVRYKFDCSAGTYYIKKSTYARPGDTALTVFSTNKLNYLNIPIAFTYHFGTEKFHWYATAGAGINILTDQYLETGFYNYNYDEYESITTNLKTNYYNAMIGAGIQWQAAKKLSFTFSPQYQFAITPMNENMPVKAYPRIFSLQLGMQIRL